MPVRRVNPNRVKLRRSYSVEELARCLDVHKNTVRHWQTKGLEPIDKGRPVLFQGVAVRDFLTKRNASRKSHCPPGTLYCLRCREPRAPALGMVDFIPMHTGGANLRALCGCCEAIMHRRARETDIAQVMPGCTVQIVHAQLPLIRQPSLPLNCDSKCKG